MKQHGRSASNQIIRVAARAHRTHVQRASQIRGVIEIMSGEEVLVAQKTGRRAKPRHFPAQSFLCCDPSAGGLERSVSTYAARHWPKTERWQLQFAQRAARQASKNQECGLSSASNVTDWTLTMIVIHFEKISGPRWVTNKASEGPERRRAKASHQRADTVRDIVRYSTPMQHRIRRIDRIHIANCCQ